MVEKEKAKKQFGFWVIALSSWLKEIKETKNLINIDSVFLNKSLAKSKGKMARGKKVKVEDESGDI